MSSPSIDVASQAAVSRFIADIKIAECQECLHLANRIADVVSGNLEKLHGANEIIDGLEMRLQKLMENKAQPG